MQSMSERGGTLHHIDGRKMCWHVFKARRNITDRAPPKLAAFLWSCHPTLLLPVVTDAGTKGQLHRGLPLRGHDSPPPVPDS